MPARGKGDILRDGSRPLRGGLDNREAKTMRIPVAALHRCAIAAMPLILGACAGVGEIKGVRSTFVSVDTDAQVNIDGQGVCSALEVDFGDGTLPQQFANVGLPGAVHHTYTGWTGPKRVKAKGTLNCQGSAGAEIVVTPATMDFGFGPGRMACYAVNLPPLRKNVTVTMSWLDPPGAKVNFGCPFGGCIREPDGEPDPAPSKFAFPGFRAHSLLVRVGTQVVQGGNTFTFTTTESGPLELCTNDEDYTDNSGGWGLEFRVDERQATP